MALTLIVFITESWKWIETQASIGMKNSDTDVTEHNTVCQEWKDESVVDHV